MAIFPEIYPDYKYMFYPRFLTKKIGPTDGYFTQRRRVLSNPLYTAELSYSYITKEDERTLIEFLIARQGSYDSFVFYDFELRDYTDEYVGTGDNSTTIFNLPARDVENLTVYLDGSSTSAYTLTARAGGNGRDKIEFSTAPGADVVITADYLGRKYVENCIFRKDYLKNSVVTFTRNNITNVIIDQVN